MPKLKSKAPKVAPEQPVANVFYCPRSCHKGRTYPTLAAVIKHVELQHPDHDPDWWVD